MEEKEEKNLKEEIKDLKEAVSALIELQKLQIKAQFPKAEPQAPTNPKENSEELEAQLKEYPIGELIIYALKRNLIKKGITGK